MSWPNLYGGDWPRPGKGKGAQSLPSGLEPVCSVSKTRPFPMPQTT